MLKPDADDIIDPPRKARENPPRHGSNVLYKVAYAAVILAVLPLLPAQSPCFTSNAVVARGWELLRLLVVGVAVSYGLFSSRSTDTESEKEQGGSWKPDATATDESFVSRFLQVPPVSDEDDVESPTGSSPEEGKMQAWSSRYYRNEPVVMLAETRDDRGGGANPLRLPVRSLKSSIQDTTPASSFRSSNDTEALNVVQREPENGVACPSPIPWRSRSGRFELKEEPEGTPPPLRTSAMETDLGPSRSSSFRSRKLPPFPSLSAELRSKSSDELGRKKKNSSHTSSAPPPPPPPPPPPFRHGYVPVPAMDERRRSFKDELKDASIRGRGEGSKVPPPPLPAKSVRTVRSTKEARRSPPSEKVVVASDDSYSDSSGAASDSESSGGGDEEEPQNAASGAGAAADEGAAGENEVDKKANEFIAKFREQIRLQRIESIKRSTAGGGQRSRNKDLKNTASQ